MPDDDLDPVPALKTLVADVLAAVPHATDVQLGLWPMDEGHLLTVNALRLPTGEWTGPTMLRGRVVEYHIPAEQLDALVEHTQAMNPGSLRGHVTIARLLPQYLPR